MSWDQVNYTFVEKGRHQAPQDNPAQRLLSLRMWPAKNILRLRNKWRTWSKSGDLSEGARKFPTWTVPVMRMYGRRRVITRCPAFFQQPTPFPHIPFVHCTYSVHFTTLLVDFRHTNISIEFKNRITNRISQVAGLLFSCSSLKTTTN
jgi:hypothetical protein